MTCARRDRRWRGACGGVRGLGRPRTAAGKNVLVGAGALGSLTGCGERTGAYVSENQNLLAEQRRALILDEVRRRGGVRVNELTR